MFRRANTWGEELRGPSFERECLEETCNRKELIEIYKKGKILNRKVEFPIISELSLSPAIRQY